MRNRVAVLGGGIAGLATAWHLQRAGHQPVVFEANDSLGGLGATFSHEGQSIECFYHVMINSDQHLLGLLDQVGLLPDVSWTRTGMGFYVGGHLYPFNTAVDLLRFGGLNPVDRLRTGVAALRLSRRKEAEELHDIPVDEFLRREFGTSAFEKIWRPLLRAKFGDMYHNVPAYWFWSRMRREKSAGPEVKGYIKGGYARIASVLERAISNGGGLVLKNSPVDLLVDEGDTVRLSVRGSEQRFDAVVSTLPLPLLRKISGVALRRQVPLPELPYQGVVNVVLVMRQALQPYYWNAVLDPRFPFQGVVETSRVIPAEWRNNRHIAYLMNYCQPGSESYEKSNVTLATEAIQGLKALYPNFDATQVEGWRVFRAPHVEPVWPLGYQRQKPEPRIGDSNVFLCTTAQAYPAVNSWNTSVGLAKNTAEAVHAALETRRTRLVEVA